MSADARPAAGAVEPLRLRWGVSLAAVGGLLVFAADHPAEWVWLQWVAFAPLLWACERAPSWRRAALLGGVFGLARFAPLAVMLGGLGVPPAPAAALSLYLLALDAIFGASVVVLRRGPVVVAALGVGLSFAALEWLDALLPMWGTAKCLARSWVVVPEVMGGLLRLGGPFLVAFVVVSVQALVVFGLARRRWTAVVAMGGLLASIPIANLVGSPVSTDRLRVGAVAWPRRGDEAVAERLVADAAARGARLVVMPEGAFEVLPGQRSAFLDRWGGVAREHGIHLVVGYIDRDEPGNRLSVFEPSGAELGRYTKTHIIPVTETHPPGDGRLLVFDVDGVSVGTMICQDDNFRDLTRAYVDAGVDLVVVPTFEGPPQVAPYHYRNARLRTQEFPVTLVRAASRGTSAVVAAGGEVVAAVDHPRQGAAAVVADAPY